MGEVAWEEMSDNELIHLHNFGKLPPEAARAIGEEQLRLVVSWDGINGPPPPLRPEPAKPPGPDYNSMTNDDLRAILVGRGLDVGGRKEKMVARLTKSDEAADAAEAEDGEVNDDGAEDDEGEDDSPDTEPSEKAKAKKKRD